MDNDKSRELEKTSAETEIGGYRKELDGLDRELVRLFERRLDVARRIGETKRKAGLPVFDAGRENEVIAGRKELLKDAGRGDMLEAFFRQLMDFSKRVQRPDARSAVPKVCYQGVEGSYGYEASRRYFGQAAQYFSVRQFDNVLEAVISGEADYGVLPIENSIAGYVNPSLDILADYRCFINGEVVLPIAHCLLAPQGALLEELTEVSSHQQALMQCSRFLARHPGISTRLSENTAVAARQVGERRDPKAAAIASRACADLYGLTVLSDKIQNVDENYTRFIIIARSAYKRDDWNKASIRFVLPHESGALEKMLRIPAEMGINLTTIASRPYPVKSFQYYFYADLTGDSAAQLDMCLKNMEKQAVEWDLLGTYPSAESRPVWAGFGE